jgi:hypothetical protein
MWSGSFVEPDRARITGGCPAAQIRRPADEYRWAVYDVKADNNKYKRA